MKLLSKISQYAYEKIYAFQLAQQDRMMNLLDRVSNYAYKKFYAYKLAKKGKFGGLIESTNKDIQVFIKGFNTGHKHIVSFKNKKLFKIIDVDKQDGQKIVSLNFETGRVFKSTVTSDAFAGTRTLERRMFELLPNRESGFQLGRNQKLTLEYDGTRWCKADLKV